MNSPAPRGNQLRAMIGRLAVGFCVFSLGCVPELSSSEQKCVECALRRRDSQHAAEAALRFANQCQAGDPASCSALGVIYEEGRGVRADPHKAAALYQRACTAGNAVACVNLGQLYEGGATGAPDTEGAEVMYQAACERGYGEGCYHLGAVRYQVGSVGPAAKALDRGCAAGHPRSCEVLGVMYKSGLGVPKNERRAKALFAEACRGGADGACQRL